MTKKYWPAIGCLLIVISLAATNYTPGTWLIGWDNLHPEFNFWLNIKRSLFAVWQEYQGVGLLGGMGHAADLPRQIILWIASIVIPVQLLRYLYHFSMLLVGVLGIYKLSKDFILTKLSDTSKMKASFLSALFYLLNLGTIQYFFVPFEPYSTFWGLLPWEIYVLLQYLNNSSRKNLILLVLINLLAVPQGYVQTIFLVYLICTGIFICGHIIKEKSLKALIRSGKVLGIIFVINAFWLLPSIYFMRNNFLVNRNAVQNYMATDKFFMMNKKRGTFGDFIYLKEFYYDFVNFDHTKGDFDYMMKAWRNQYAKPAVSVLGGLLFIVILTGLARKNKYWFELTAIFILSCIFFLSDTFFFSWINEFLRLFPVNDQLFRNPFTKFIVPTVFVFSLFFGVGIGGVLEFLKRFDRKILAKVFFLVFLLIFFYINLPAWRGNLIYRYEQIKIPDEYFTLFDYLNKNPDKGRIANFPQSNIWGWEYYNWGLTGSGFSWYAVEQPFLDRAFDVWSSTNENYYWEMTNALYSENQKLFNGVLEKYQIKWVLVDQNTFSYTPYKAQKIESLIKILDSSNKVIDEKIFGKITLYEIRLDTAPNSFVFLAQNLPLVGPEYKWNNYDKAYEEYGNYVTKIKDEKSENKDSTGGFGGLFGFTTTKQHQDGDSRIQSNYQNDRPESKIIDHNLYFLVKNQHNPQISNVDIKHDNITLASFLSTNNAANKNAKVTAPAFIPISANSLYSDRENRNIFSEYHGNNNIVNKVFAVEGSDSSTEVSSGFDVYYPFRSLFTGRKQEELEFEAEDKKAFYVFKAQIPKSMAGGELIIPSLKKEEISEFDTTDFSNIEERFPLVFLDGELVDTTSLWKENFKQDKENIITIPLSYIKEGNLEIRIPKTWGYYSYDSEINDDLIAQLPKSCDLFNQGIYRHDLLNENGRNILRLTSVGSSNCLDFDLPSLSQRLSYLVSVESNNIEGKSLLFSIINKNSERADLETYLSAKALATAGLPISNFILPPMEDFAQGYTLHFDNISIGRVKTVNDLGRITVNPIPYRLLTGIKVVKNNQNSQLPMTNYQLPISVDHPNPSYYQLQITNNKEQITNNNLTLVLSQSFDSGWHAYEITSDWLTDSWYMKLLIPLFGKEIKDHVLVNNWENGWRLNNLTMQQFNNATINQSNNRTIVILYLPQYLEYLGFGMLGLSILFPYLISLPLQSGISGVK